MAAIGAPIASHVYPAAIGRIAPLADFFNPGAADPALPDRAAPTSRAACKRQYYKGDAPAYVHRGLDRRTTTVCYTAFAIGYSGITRTPLWSAERLTAEAVASGKGFNRDGMEFHPDAHIPGRDRSLLSDYRRSGWSRGHMAPSADMPTRAARQESFSLANIVPQDEDMNSELWNDTEQAVRRLATKHGTIYVVTGPVFARGKLDSLNDRVAIPSAIYKAVLIPGQGAAVFYAANKSERSMAIVSVAQLASLTGIDPFPEASAATKARAIELFPAQSGRRNRRFQAW
ncbi:endonuclease G [Sphingobium wenxiniae]|uniref:DNA/RNA non-specific endonuclease n=1 Tax=Sphingobium TaxID=165695 RepID=UPI00131530F9|nr:MULTISPECIES: DNA/RNA non-specific endonuclease [Sphingobium]MBB6193114.1 endonuclease G [Sphingobium wenxiniae]